MSYHAEDANHLDVFTQALERFEDAFAIYDKDYNLVFANAAAYDAMPAYFTALDRGQSIQDANRAQIQSFSPNISEDTLSAQTDMMIERFYAGEAYEVTVTKNRTIQVRHESFNEHYTLALGIDVTEIKSQQAKMETLAQDNYRLANTDQLTGLANRRKFISTLEDKIAQCKASNSSFYLGLIDLNGFKRINDLYGHAIGDELLTGIARRAVGFIEETTHLARLGGDEFALITPLNEAQANLRSQSAELCGNLRQPFCLSGNDISVSASLGWAAFPADGETSSELLQKADYALYKSKHSGSKGSVVFSGSDESVLTREAKISHQLETANLEDELYLEFQPIFDTHNNIITGLEALIRWGSPTLGLVSPLDFIPLAEKTGHITALTKIILKKALQHAVHWPKSIDLHVNISTIDLGKVQVISELIDIIEHSTYPAHSVIFEVTETAAIDTFENTLETFDLIESSGVRLALDDFGTGFSSLSYLARIPVRCLKVDKHFIDSLVPNSPDEKILKTIIYLCENLEIDCIVEGVETRSQFDQLISLGTKHMQGFYFSKSMKPQNLAAFMFNYAQQYNPRNSVDTLIKTSRVA